MSEAGAAIDVAELDRMSAERLAPLLASCCGSSAWVSGMLERRPFGSLEALLAAAEQVWWSLSPEDWHEAFSHHPRIGERDATRKQDSRAKGWSAEEQRGVDEDAAARAAIAAANVEYEQRFGHIYLVSAAGKSAEELLQILRERLGNDATTELRVAAGEQVKITTLRLKRLLAERPAAESGR